MQANGSSLSPPLLSLCWRTFVSPCIFHEGIRAFRSSFVFRAFDRFRVFLFSFSKRACQPTPSIAIRLEQNDRWVLERTNTLRKLHCASRETMQGDVMENCLILVFKIDVRILYERIVQFMKVCSSTNIFVRVSILVRSV